jgi:hypothetical protein
MTSTFPRELTVTRPAAFKIQLAATAPEERTMLKVVFWATAFRLATANTRAIVSAKLTLFIIDFLLIYSVYVVLPTYFETFTGPKYRTKESMQKPVSNRPEKGLKEL